MKILIFITLYSVTLLAAKYEVNGGSVEFIYIEKKLVSNHCKNQLCIALTKKVSKDELKEFDLKFGKNPATAACKYLQGEIALAISELKHRTFFCKFKDNSYIHSGHLLP